ncbi:MAG: hypothetical protein QOF76_1811, partial [Solirubrobacteraceae bacterium]|nr:hypothetical protein [Solirubrobacteraceae bacterium]
MLPAPVDFAVEIGVGEAGRFVLRTGHEVPIAIEGDGDRGVPHEDLQRLQVDPGAIIKEANVCRQSCRVIGVSPAA